MVSERAIQLYECRGNVSRFTTAREAHSEIVSNDMMFDKLH